MSSAVELVQEAIARNPDGSRFLSRLLACFADAHWGAVRAPGRLRASAMATLARDVEPPARFAAWAARHLDELEPSTNEGAPVVTAIEAPVHILCCIETDTFVLAIEDATTAPLDTGTAAYAARHRISRVIEAVRAVSDGRLYAVGIVAHAGFEEPRRTTILQGLPHLGREEAEDLYASYWGWCTPEQLARALDAQ